MLLPCVSSIQFAVLCGCVCLSVPNLYSDCFASCNNWHLWYDIGYKCTETLPLHQVGSPSSPFGQSPGVSLRPLPPLPRLLHLGLGLGLGHAHQLARALCHMIFPLHSAKLSSTATWIFYGCYVRVTVPTCVLVCFLSFRERCMGPRLYT